MVVGLTPAEVALVQQAAQRRHQHRRRPAGMSTGPRAATEAVPSRPPRPRPPPLVLGPDGSPLLPPSAMPRPASPPVPGLTPPSLNRPARPAPPARPTPEAARAAMARADIPGVPAASPSPPPPPVPMTTAMARADIPGVPAASSPADTAPARPPETPPAGAAAATPDRTTTANLPPAPTTGPWSPKGGRAARGAAAGTAGGEGVAAAASVPSVEQQMALRLHQRWLAEHHPHRACSWDAPHGRVPGPRPAAGCGPFPGGLLPPRRPPARGRPASEGGLPPAGTGMTPATAAALAEAPQTTPPSLRSTASALFGFPLVGLPATPPARRVAAAPAPARFASPGGIPTWRLDDVRQYLATPTPTTPTTPALAATATATTTPAVPRLPEAHKTGQRIQDRSAAHTRRTSD
ncbi:hypothetical protein PAPYR_2167 [Paratrimastix pyriformis]|uniref:Uncharacterized protein n=1 Tax=Paratrimastix pyriformis TaxID=342808 RepID=A0ABQ8UW37_9EUKA|nr:hypothetical protein PAPYR_2167 [Paratrimastix pyriformis]